MLAAAVSAVALRIPFIGELAYTDEGGYLLVARQWHAGGSALYGDLFVDRPPLLMLFWRLVDANGGIEMARWFACLGVLILVACAGCAGNMVGGARGAVWSAVTAAALASTPALGAREVNAELLAAPLLMASCTSTLMALRRTSPIAHWLWAVAAGLLGALAPLVKQNFVDSLAFATVLVIASMFAGTLPRRFALRVLAGGAMGALVPVVVTALWAETTAPGLGGLWYALYGFRSDASRVILSQSIDAPLSRLFIMLGAAVGTGLLGVIVCYLVSSRRRLRQRDPLTVAVTTMLALGLVGVALGFSYWAHYLIGLIPMLCLAAGSLAEKPRRRHVTVVAFVAASAVVATVASIGPMFASRTTEASLTQLLRDASRETDSVVITYGHPNLMEGAGLQPAYPYVWSLPLRVLDPRLSQLTRTVAGPSAPTWLVEWEPFDTWGIDTRKRLVTAVDRHYRRVATVCGVAVYLHNGETRPMPANADRCLD